jgi:hypothetical protein
MEIRQHFLAVSRVFVRAFGNPQRIFYPGCGNDGTPSRAFPDADIVYLDIAEHGLAEIRSAFPGARTVHAPAEAYASSEPFDLVLDIHSHAPFEAEVRQLKRGGYLLVANKTSDRAFDSSSFKLVAAIHVEGCEMRVELANLEKYREVDPEPPRFSFSNTRKLKAQYYVFRRRVT